MVISVTNPARKTPKRTPKAPRQLLNGLISLYIHSRRHDLIDKPDCNAIHLRRVLDRAVTGAVNHFDHILLSMDRGKAFVILLLPPAISYERRGMDH